MADEKVDHVALLVAIARLEGKMDAVLRRVDDHLANDDMVHKDHEKRLRWMERSAWRLQGLAGVVAATVSAGIAWLFKGGV